MGRIIFTDGIGQAVLHNGKPAPSNRFSNWTPRPLPFGDKANRQSDAALTMIRLRDDFGATFDLTGIPVKSQKTNLIEINGDIIGTLGTLPTGFGALVAPNTMVSVLAGSPSGRIGDVGYNGIIAQHTRDLGTGDSMQGAYSVAIINGHHLSAAAWLYLPSAAAVTGVSFGWESASVGSIVTANADLTKRDQWQQVTTTATATANGTAAPVLRVAASSTSVIYSDLWSISDLDDGLFTRMLDNADRLAYHLENGGTCQVDTGDYEANSYATCGLYPGAQSQPPVLSDKKNLEYTLSLNLVNLAGSPARMRCHYL